MRYELSLLYMGSALMDDPILRGSLRRQAEARGWCVVAERRLPRMEPDTPLELQRELERPGHYLIVADEETFALAGRILATLAERPLLLSATGLLAPDNAREVTETSFTLELEAATVTLLRRDDDAPYPPLPLPEPGSKAWQCFPLDEREERELLRRLGILGEERVAFQRRLPGWLHLRACGEESVAQMEELLHSHIARIIPRTSLVRAFIDYFTHAGKTLTFAESCTGGRLAAAITAESGSSAILEGSYVTYANRIKAGWLGVENSTLEEHGAVSAQCVREMARGAQRNLEADIAVAISGIAGPTGAVPGKPVGTVYLCVRNGDRERVLRLQLGGDRNAVQEQAVLHALKMVLESEEKIFEFFSKNP